MHRSTGPRPTLPTAPSRSPAAIEYAGGYDVEIAKKIAEGLGKKLVIVKTIWDGLPPAVESGTIDAIIAGMSPTAERKLTIDFTDTYYRSELVLVVKKGGAYENATSLADFSGAKVTAQLSTFHYTVIDQIPGVAKQTAMDDFPAMRVALEVRHHRRLRLRASGRHLGSRRQQQFRHGRVRRRPGFTTTDDDVAVAVGLKKGQADLVAKINTILAGITEDQRKATDGQRHQEPAGHPTDCR